MLDQEKDTSVKHVTVNVSALTPQRVAPGLWSTRRPLLQVPSVEKTEEPISKRESELEVMPRSNDTLIKEGIVGLIPEPRSGRNPVARVLIPPGYLHPGKGKH